MITPQKQSPIALKFKNVVYLDTWGIEVGRCKMKGERPRLEFEFGVPVRHPVVVLPCPVPSHRAYWIVLRRSRDMDIAATGRSPSIR